MPSPPKSSIHKNAIWKARHAQMTHALCKPFCYRQCSIRVCVSVKVYQHQRENSNGFFNFRKKRKHRRGLIRSKCVSVCFIIFYFRNSHILCFTPTSQSKQLLLLLFLLLLVIYVSYLHGRCVRPLCLQCAGGGGGGDAHTPLAQLFKVTRQSLFN